MERSRSPGSQGNQRRALGTKGTSVPAAVRQSAASPPFLLSICHSASCSTGDPQRLSVRSDPIPAIPQRHPRQLVYLPGCEWSQPTAAWLSGALEWSEAGRGMVGEPVPPNDLKPHSLSHCLARMPTLCHEACQMR